METNYFFMGYDFFSKLRDGQAKRREYEDAIERAVKIQNKKEYQKFRFIQKKSTHIDKLGEEPIFEDVIKTIRQCDTAIFDLTSRVSIYEYNLNVIFELGAAFDGRLSGGFPRYVAYFYHNQTSKDRDEVKDCIAKDISDLSLAAIDKNVSRRPMLLEVYEDYDELSERLAEVLIQRGMR